MLLDNWNGKKIVDLSQTISHMQYVNNPGTNQRPAFWDRITHETTKGTFLKEPELSWHMRDVLMGEHISTHVDALCHFTPGNDAWCMEKMPARFFIGPAVCVDLSHIPSSKWISVQDLKDALEKTGLKPEPIFLYHLDYYQRAPEPPYPTDWAGLDWDATNWLADQGVINIGCETPSIDNYQAMRSDSDPCFPAHRACRKRAITNIENLANLSPVVGKRFLYIGLPLKLRGGTGCPIRAMAVLED